MKRKEITEVQNNASVHSHSISQGVGFSRREFFKLSGLGLTGFFFSQVAKPMAVLAQSNPPTIIGKAKYCVFVHLIGAPSHLDTFDLKEGSWTPKDFNPVTSGNIRWPSGIMPKLTDQLPKIGLVRSMSAWALVHPLAQIWSQIGRNPASGLSKIAPNIGAVAALEFETKRASSQKLPGFVALNASGSLQEQGYLNPQYAPFLVTPNPAGLTNASHPDGQDRFLNRYAALQTIDADYRQKSVLGSGTDPMTSSYGQARELMYNPAVQPIFQYSTNDSQSYGNTSFGNACLLARNLIKSDMGTRFIQIDFGSWDMHSNIYDTRAGIYPMAKAFDGGLAQLMADLAATPSKDGGTLLDQTLIVAMGEFGRTPGPITNQQGRDHYLQMSALFAGAGIKGNNIIGKTDANGAATVEYGWSRETIIRPEDVFCTIYSALGIDYTTVRTDDPFKRGFEYVPDARYGAYAPILELW